MKLVLGRKQNIQNQQWIDALNQIESLVSKDEVNEYAEKALERIRDVTHEKKAAAAWSGGKDSLVLADLCRQAGISDYVFAHTKLEYPQFLSWCLEHKPDGCSVVCTGQDIEWLAKHEDMIFPDAKGLNRWYQIVQRTVFTKYFFDNHLDVLLVGHRKADGNFTGKDGMISKASGETRYAPLYDWPHEVILAYIHYHNLALPPIYGWQDGFRCGTHPWPSRVRATTQEDNYRAVYNIDPTIIRAAALTIPSAKSWLESEATKE
jgi:3'-phosphoadenosine 5'-phosphosulfate sulfotransferase (PAPS reductase)/FAD synthetase